MICCFLSHIFSYPSQEKSIFVWILRGLLDGEW
jgi:hypothetical protein